MPKPGISSDKDNCSICGITAGNSYVCKGCTSNNSAKEQQPCGEHNNERGVICSDIICTYCISGAGGGHACHVDCKDYNCFEGRKLNE